MHMMTADARWYDGAIMPSRTQVTLDQDLDRQAKARAAELGVSFAEYVRRLIQSDLGELPARPSVVDLFGIGDSGGSDVAMHKDEYIAEALEADLP